MNRWLGVDFLCHCVCCDFFPLFPLFCLCYPRINTSACGQILCRLHHHRHALDIFCLSSFYCPLVLHSLWLFLTFRFFRFAHIIRLVLFHVILSLSTPFYLYPFCCAGHIRVYLNLTTPISSYRYLYLLIPLLVLHCLPVLCWSRSIYCYPWGFHQSIHNNVQPKFSNLKYPVVCSTVHLD